jgi:carbon storage regulator
MLILTRRVNEVIVIGDNIRIKIVGYDHETGRVRLGIDAPRTIIVDREEIAIRRKQNGSDHVRPEQSGGGEGQ